MHTLLIEERICQQSRNLCIRRAAKYRVRTNGAPTQEEREHFESLANQAEIEANMWGEKAVKAFRDYHDAKVNGQIDE